MDFESVAVEASAQAGTPVRAELYRPGETRRTHGGEILLPMVTSMMRAN